MKHKEYMIWCDESVKKGKFYSNFYGGVLVKSGDLEYVQSVLKKVVDELHIQEEIKWQKVDAFKLPAFIAMIDVFFEMVKQDKIKVRIMFTHNAKIAKGLNDEHYQNEFFLLYYQFVKHCFGLEYSNSTNSIINIKTYFDNLPDTYSKRQQFKDYVKGLERTGKFIKAGIKLKKENITEVDSKEHLPMQFLDVVLGSMQFRLNNMHLEKPVGKKRRGKRTIAKDKLYKHINKKIREIRPNFNIGISTGTNELEDRWNHPYRHWCFVAKEFEIDESKHK